MSAGHDLGGVYVAGSHSVDSLSYVSGVSDKDCSNSQKILHVKIINYEPYGNPQIDRVLTRSDSISDDCMPDEAFAKDLNWPVVD